MIRGGGAGQLYGGKENGGRCLCHNNKKKSWGQHRLGILKKGQCVWARNKGSPPHECPVHLECDREHDKSFQWDAAEEWSTRGKGGGKKVDRWSSVRVLPGGWVG